MSELRKPIPRATYRLQLNKDFRFADAARLAPYLAALGISHVYASPFFRARPGSTHGYDVVSHTELNPELGTPEDFAAMVAAFRQNGLGQIVDFVPNHMGVGGADNPFWLDVLEWGQDSHYAGWFDIEWDPESRYLRDRLLVPFLGAQYGAVLQSGALSLKFDAAEGAFAVWAYDTHKLPVSPLSYAEILGSEHPELERLSDAFAHLSGARPNIARRAFELKAELAEAAAANASVADALERAVAAFHGEPGSLDGWARLDALISRQRWRPAHFRVAADDINYRRFFNINDLAGIRVEIPEVFDHTHAFVLGLVEDGVLDGLRIDHIDGLLDPKAYCLRLREEAQKPIYLIVEKILAPHESLREDWETDGTTGYEFANLLTGLLVDPAGEDALTRAYHDFTGNRQAFDDVVYEAKLLIMENAMASELNVLAREAGRVARSHPMTADFTNNVLRRALKQVVACFPVYRTYVDADGPDDADRRDIDWAIAQARRSDTLIDASVFDFLHGLLTGDLAAHPKSGYSRVAVTHAAMRFQQYSGPVMAKGLEDTAFYRHNILLALNEVGGSPERFGVSIAQFHLANQQRLERTPHAMLSTSTHDTKRGEDTRARLSVLSEMPGEWRERVTLWSRMLRAREAGLTEEPPPARDDEYVFYQLVAGAWPPELSDGPLDAAGLELFRARIEGAILKSMREAKVHTNWDTADEAYEAAVLDFIRHALDAERNNPFLESLQEFMQRLAPLGTWNSLVQTTLKLTAPGVPDIYQGAELWDFSLVDPDNRRTVDFDRRASLLKRTAIDAPMAEGALQQMLGNWRDGAVKIEVAARLLGLRRRFPALFANGSYEAVSAEGREADRVCAFLRLTDRAEMLVAALLFPARGPFKKDAGETTLTLPDRVTPQGWVDVFTGQRVAADRLSSANLFDALPIAVLMREAS